MVNEEFGTVNFNGRMVNLDNESVEKLEEMAKIAEKKYSDLEKKALTIFNQ